MKCPNCNETLLMTHRNNIEIDYCPSCRGVWLDKGELDKLLEFDARSGGSEQDKYDDHDYHQHDRDDDKRHYDHHTDRNKYPRKKKSFLGNIFDFD